MPRYYFDLRDDDGLSVDYEGMELPSIEAVQEEAARSLADMARDTVRKPSLSLSRNHRLAIEVRDEDGQLMIVKFTFEIDRSK
jgi:hypothetical protein